MAVVDEMRTFGGLERRVGDIGRAVSDAQFSPTLMAKAAATLGLPNLLQRGDDGEGGGGFERRDATVIWQTESCCSCTPLACMAGRSAQSKTGEAEETVYVQSASGELHTELETHTSIFRTTDAANTTAASGYHSAMTLEVQREGEGELGSEEEVPAQLVNGGGTEAVEDGGESSSTCCGQVRRPPNRDQVSVSVQQQNSKTMYRRRVADYEKEWTFRPKLSLASLRLASQVTGSNLPVMHRLYDNIKPSSASRLQENFTFCPKLNAASLRLAQERAAKLPEVQARISQVASQTMTEAFAQHTFQPHICRRSMRITQHMDTDFQARQQQHLLRRHRKLEEVSSKPSRLRSQHHHCKRSRPITLPPASLPSTPPRGTTNTAALTHSSTPSPSTPPRGTTLPATLTHSNTPSPSHDRGGDRKTKLLYRRASRSPHPSSKARRSLCKSSHKDSTSFSSDERPKTSPGSSPTKRSSSCGSKKATPTSPPLQLWSQLSDVDRVKRVRTLGEKIIKEKKVFVCRGGYKTIHRCLRERGWVERDYATSEGLNKSDSPVKAKSAPASSGRTSSVAGGRSGGRGRSRDPGHTSSSESSDADSGGSDGEEGEEEGRGDERSEQEYRMLCRVVRNADPNFVWTLRRDDVLYRNRNMVASTIANHYAKASSFTTKVGLCTNLRSLVWCGGANSDLFFPRCYLLSCDEEKDAFIDDYRFTAALNLLKLVVDQHWGEFRSPNNSYSTTPPRNQPPSKNSSETLTKPLNSTVTSTLSKSPSKIGPSEDSPTPEAIVERPVVPEEAVALAVQGCEAYLGFRQHDDIEEGTSSQLSDNQWKTLVQYYYNIVLDRGHFKCSTEMVRRASNILEEMEKYLPQLHMDGTRNIWIVKPGAMSRGRGIMCLERLEPILELVSCSVRKDSRWVVQKYIERPLLIHNTKFDIRQWFLVTDWNPLTMWMYKDCYLRFATQKFTLDNMNESIHLCNNSIQKNYINSDSRSELLPDENMWHSSTFKDYLESMGQPRQWDQVIYPGMKHALTCALQVSQDLVKSRKNSFELYGADFMLTDDFTPWLIEINCSPTMEASTSVTSQLCREVMEDTIRVVLDRREDKNCDTGKFELAYKQPKLDTPAYVGIQLCVEGVAIHRSHTHHHSVSLPLPTATLSYST